MSRSQMATWSLATLFMLTEGAACAQAAGNRGVNDAAEVVSVGNIATAGETLGVASAFPYALLVTGGNVDIIDVSHPAMPERVATLVTPGFAQAVAVTGRHAYVADYFQGLEVIDFARTASPTIVGNVKTPGAALGIAVAGHYAYVPDGFSLQVIDIAHAAHPFIAGRVAIPGQALGVAVAADYAYVASGSEGLQVVDVSSPDAPQIAGNVDTPDEAQGVAVFNGYAFVADSVSLQIIAVSQPSHPVITARAAVPAFGVAIRNNFLYIATGWGMEVLDISNPRHPSSVYRTDTRGFTRRVAVSPGGRIYLSDGTDMRLFELRDR